MNVRSGGVESVLFRNRTVSEPLCFYYEACRRTLQVWRDNVSLGG